MADMAALDYFAMAEKLNKEFSDVLIEKKLHYRGNFNSFSLISLSSSTPEMGTSGLKTEEQGLKALSKIDETLSTRQDKIDEGRSRSTPEKELQAWIINHSLNHDKTLPFATEMKFLTSEILFQHQKDGAGKAGKRLNDILAIDSSGALVVIELKTERAKKELTGQVIDFCSFINANRPLFEKLVPVLSEDYSWSGHIKKMVVWPEGGQSARDDWAEGIVEVRYKKNGDQYEFISA